MKDTMRKYIAHPSVFPIGKQSSVKIIPLRFKYLFKPETSIGLVALQYLPVRSGYSPHTARYTILPFLFLICSSTTVDLMLMSFYYKIENSKKTYESYNKVWNDYGVFKRCSTLDVDAK